MTSLDKPHSHTLRVVFYAHVKDVLTQTEKQYEDELDLHYRVGGRIARSKGSSTESTESVGTRGGGSATLAAAHPAKSAAQHPIASAPPNCQNQDVVSILDSEMDNGHTVRQWVEQAHTCCDWFLSNPKVGGIRPPNAVQLSFKPIDIDCLDVASCVKIITLYHKENGEASGHFLQELAPGTPTFTMDLTKESDQRVKEIFDSGPLQMEMKKSGRHPGIPMHVQQAMNTKAEQTKHIVFVVPDDKRWISLRDEPNACWKRWALNREERGTVWHSEMAYSKMNEDVYSAVLFTEAEMMCGNPRQLDYDDPNIAGCMRFVPTTATPAIGQQSEGEKDGDASNVQKRFEGMFMQGAAVATSVAISTTATSKTEFCPPNIAIVLTFEILTKCELISTTQMSDQKDCPICLEKLQEDKIPLQCKHFLCSDCCDLLLEDASKKCCRCIECPQCRTATFPQQLAQFGDADRQARFQLQIAQKTENKRVSSQFFWWCRDASNRTLFRVASHLKCEAIYQNVKTLLESQQVNLQNYETFVHSVNKIFTDWMHEARSNSRKINAKIQECSRSMHNANDGQSINCALKQLQKLITDLEQQTKEEADIVDYIAEAKINIQAVFCGLTCNLQETRTLETLRAWQCASVGTQILPPGWGKHCVSEEDLDKYGHILRYKWPKSFSLSEMRPQKVRKTTPPVSKPI